MTALGRITRGRKPFQPLQEGFYTTKTQSCHSVVWCPPPRAMHRPVSGIPTLLISGCFDTLTSLAWAKAAAAKLAKATIISIPDIGHFVSPAWV
jgi:pimeloyl-ACP methyl ester carboxylesterase